MGAYRCCGSHLHQLHLCVRACAIAQSGVPDGDGPDPESQPVRPSTDRNDFGDRRGAAELDLRVRGPRGGWNSDPRASGIDLRRVRQGMYGITVRPVGA